jgi:hypothetical protein
VQRFPELHLQWLLLHDITHCIELTGFTSGPLGQKEFFKFSQVNFILKCEGSRNAQGVKMVSSLEVELTAQRKFVRKDTLSSTWGSYHTVFSDSRSEDTALSQIVLQESY